MLIGSNKRYQCNGQRISGSNILVVGDDNLILGYDNEIHGSNNTIRGDRVKVCGNNNKITGNFAKVLSGDYNSIDTNNNTGEFVYPSGINNTFVIRPALRVNIAAARPLVVHSRVIEKKKRARDADEDVRFVEGPLPTDVHQDKNVPDGMVDQKTCIICLERVPCCVALPCMHLSYCITCARSLCFGASGTELYEVGKVKCSECRVVVDAIKRTF